MASSWPKEGNETCRSVARIQRLLPKGRHLINYLTDGPLSTNVSGDRRQVDMVFNMPEGSILGGAMTLHLDSDGWRVDGLQADDIFSLF